MTIHRLYKFVKCGNRYFHLHIKSRMKDASLDEIIGIIQNRIINNDESENLQLFQRCQELLESPVLEQEDELIATRDALKAVLLIN